MLKSLTHQEHLSFAIRSKFELLLTKHKYFSFAQQLLLFTITHTIRVCKEVSAWKQHQYGEVADLAFAVGVSHRFADKVITAVNEGKEASFFSRKVRRDALLVLEDLVLSLQEERNSWSCPATTISVAYRVRRDKFLLNNSKRNLINLFLKEFPQHKFKTSVLLRSWPRNFKTPISRNRVRNACPIHSNFQRLQQALYSCGVQSNIVKSCRAASVLAMCDNDCVVSLDPLCWQYDCAMCVCEEYPDIPWILSLGLICHLLLVLLSGRKVQVAVLAEMTPS